MWKLSKTLSSKKNPDMGQFHILIPQNKRHGVKIFVGHHFKQKYRMWECSFTFFQIGAML